MTGTTRSFPGIERVVPGLLALASSLTFLTYAWRFNRFSSKMFSFLWEEHGMTEAFAGVVETSMIILLLLSAMCIWITPIRWWAMAGVAVMASEMLAETFMPGAKYPSLYWAEWMVRITVPLVAILLFQTWEKSNVWRGRIMRFAIAATFAAHGLKALLGIPQFIDYLLVFFREIGWSSIAEVQALAFLHVIGAVDIILASHLLFCRPESNRKVLVWMAIWGAVTAFSRIVYGGWGNGHEVLIRCAHVAMPIALLLLWRTQRKDEPSPT